MVHCEDGPEVGGGGENPCQPIELLIGDLAVVEPRNRGVEGDDPQTVDVVHRVDRCGRGFLVEQLHPEVRAVVVIAHRPDQLGSEVVGDRLDHRPEGVVSARITFVGEVAGEHQRIDPRTGTGEFGEYLKKA